MNGSAKSVSVLSARAKRAAEIAKAVTGLGFTEHKMFEVDERIVNLERVYLVHEGITRKDDYSPTRFLNQPLPNGASKGSVFEMEPMLDEYYREREWDHNGIPEREKLKKIRLNYATKDLKSQKT